MTAHLSWLFISARDQSILCAFGSMSNSNSCKVCHTPACCHSRRRRQQLIPEPQPSSWGRFSQAMPVFKTKRMPVSALRLSRGLRPGKRARLGLGGNSGSIHSHNSLSRIGLAMCVPPHHECRTCSIGKNCVAVDASSHFVSHYEDPLPKVSSLIQF